MAYHTILEKMDNAIEAFIEARRGHELDGVRLYKGFSGVEIEEDCIAVTSEEAVPEQGAEDSGNYTVRCSVSLRTLMELGGTRHTAMAGALFDLFFNSTAEAGLEGVPELTVMVMTPGTVRREVVGNSFVTEQVFEFFVAPSRPTN